MDNLEKLKSLFKRELPGNNLHVLLSPKFRDEEIKHHSIPLFDAAVGIILFFYSENLSVLFIHRTESEGPHSGQIAFPGGSKDKTDINLTETAYREIFEEIGISENQLSFVAQLSPLYIPVSRFMVYPMVFFAPELPTLTLNKSEVNNTYIFTVKDFYKPEVLSSSTIVHQNKSFSVPCFVLEKIRIWGATAMMWNECLYMLKPLFDE